MAQPINDTEHSTPYTLDNILGPAFRAQLNSIITAILTQNSGDDEPATTFPFMPWAHTSANQLKMRNGANDDWIDIGTLDQANLGLVTSTALSQAIADFATETYVTNITDNKAPKSYPEFSNSIEINASSGSPEIRLKKSNVERVAISAGSTVMTIDINGDQKYRFNEDSFTPWTVYGDIDLGSGLSGLKWDDIYANNGTIQTSDRNEKQDIAEIEAAEKRVAIRAKNLMRQFRWRSAVQAKGDDARIHFGIIAQDLQQAFDDEGLDAGRYGMFIKNTWWEKERIIPAIAAVPAVYDEDGKEIQAAIEGRPQETVVDRFDTQEDAPADATEHTSYGVRYSELFAFIIAAM